MRVSHVRRSNTADRSRSARGAGASGDAFHLPQGQAAARRAEISAAPAIGSIDTIVALQAVEEPSDRRRRAVETGDRILDLLDRLKIGLLSGEVNANDLNTLKKTLERQSNMENDPGLNDILRQIDLRARVELAKLRRPAA